MLFQHDVKSVGILFLISLFVNGLRLGTTEQVDKVDLFREIALINTVFNESLKRTLEMYFPKNLKNISKIVNAFQFKTINLVYI